MLFVCLVGFVSGCFVFLVCVLFVLFVLVRVFWLLSVPFACLCWFVVCVLVVLFFLFGFGCLAVLVLVVWFLFVGFVCFLFWGLGPHRLLDPRWPSIRIVGLYIHPGLTSTSLARTAYLFLLCLLFGFGLVGSSFW